MTREKNILTTGTAPLDVAVLVMNDSNTLSLAAAVDPMRAANRVERRRLFHWHYHTATGAPARLTSGIDVPGEALARLDRCDLLLVVAGFNLERHATPALCAGLRRIAATGAAIAGIDGGPWLMATAGLLDGRCATTHWEDLDRFAARFPEITVLPHRYHIDGRFLTSGGAMPAVDMMLHLIGARFGAPLATRVAGAFIHDTPARPIRAQSRIGADPRHNHVTARASALMEQTIGAPLPVRDIARQCGVSPRVLEQNFRQRLDTTPRAHYLALRLAEARRLATDTGLPIIDIALATGFASPSSFARAFRAAHGTSARALRRVHSP
ncbi:GlxA family transcriptional regulator [Jhaorihella thermophila]|uniref:Transcriptional regulator GlxA family, contains an amidase domain and an AraC-type DNA-binding HTH domain n=1 Tax=Jhaorihella thermophila TaxID=488547 RepID=A0A1H5Y0W9_9RHOB|nr:helix-turn-helix domain-containing protein [Jhaorihella thermophila]SEG17729.1 Transcriptional regulator GlxA family, contains an amidase domain and an AraC-type DNA-binding HTH domain [Jhaorihella thermophila]